MLGVRLDARQESVTDSDELTLNYDVGKLFSKGIKIL